MANKKIVYILELMIFVGFLILITIMFGISIEPGNPQGRYIIPGDESTEWLFALLLIPVTVLLSGLLALYLVSPLFLKTFAKFIGKKHKLGLVQIEDLSNKSLFLKLFSRAIILGFFISNICTTLASQEVIINFMRVGTDPTEYPGFIPDAEIMLLLIWLIAIPGTLILVPIWLINDFGLVSSRKVKGLDFQNANLAAGRIYKIIKGYAGIGFLYNLIVMLSAWAIPQFLDNIGESDMFIVLIMPFLSPLIVISFMLPLIILIDNRNASFREKTWKTLEELRLNNQIIVTVSIEKKRTIEI